MLEPLTYLAEASFFLGIVWLTYLLFLRKETLFIANRWFLFIGGIMAFLLPLVEFTKTVYLPVTSMTFSDQIALQSGVADTANYSPQIDWTHVLWGIYLIGLLVSFGYLAVGFYEIYRLGKHSATRIEPPFVHKISSLCTSPFSFFNWIFYDPSKFRAGEMELVLAHEKTHVRQWHSIDVLMAEITSCFLWFLPFAWVYKKAVRENLEFLADQATSEAVEDKRTYQYLILKEATKTQSAILTTSFNNPKIKTRIKMMNKEKSNRSNFFKALIVLPLIGLFLVAFNTKTNFKALGGDTVVTTNEYGKILEFLVEKKTTKAELEEIKNKLANEGIDFSYKVSYGDDNTITSISIKIKGKSGDNSFNSSYSSKDDENGINPFQISVDTENGYASIVSTGNQNHSRVFISKNGSKIHIDTDEDENEDTQLIVKEALAGTHITINGEEIDLDSLVSIKPGDIKILEDIDVDVDDIVSDVMVFSTSGEDDGHVKIKVHESKDSEGDSHIIKIVTDEEEAKYKIGNVVKSSTKVFVHGDEDGFLYLIDGKPVSKKEFENVNEEEIEEIRVIKKEEAQKRYGDDGQFGAIELITKKN